MIAIFKREVRSSFHGMIGYVLTAFMLAATAIYFIALNLGYGLTDFGYYTLYRTVFVLLLYIPVRPCAALRRNAAPAPTNCCSQVRYPCGASCWASFWHCVSFLRCRALWMQS